MAPPASTRISVRLKCAQEHVSPVNVLPTVFEPVVCGRRQKQPVATDEQGAIHRLQWRRRGGEGGLVGAAPCAGDSAPSPQHTHSRLTSRACEVRLGFDDPENFCFSGNCSDCEVGAGGGGVVGSERGATRGATRRPKRSESCAGTDAVRLCPPHPSPLITHPSSLTPHHSPLIITPHHSLSPLITPRATHSR